MDTAEQIVRLKRWRVSTFWVCLVGYIGYYICRKNLSAAVPLISDEFGYTNSQLGLIALYSEIAYAFGKLINGPLADKVGGRKIFLLGMVGAIFFNLVFSQMGSLTAFIVVWCLCRYFLSMGWGGLAKIVGNWYEPEKNGTVMGFISINFQFGGVVATVFAGFLVAMGVGWSGLFYYPAAVLLVIFIWSFLAMRDRPTDVIPGTKFGESPVGRKPIVEYDENGGGVKVSTIMKSLFKMPAFNYLILFSIFTTFLRSIFFFWTPKLLVDIGMGHSNAILKSALFPFLGCLGTILLGWYTDHYAENGNRAKVMWKMLLGMVFCLFLVAYFIAQKEINHSVVVILIGLCGFFLLGPYSMTSGALTLDIAGPKGAGSCTGILDGLGYLGGAVAVWGAGKISDNLGWSQVFVFLGVFALLATFSAWLLSYQYSKERR